MSENQQPLEDQEEKTVSPAEPVESDVPETEPVHIAEEDETASTTLAETGEGQSPEEYSADTEGEPEEDEADIDPADVKIFGLPRVCFHFTAGGFAIGYIICGIIGVLGQRMPDGLLGALASRLPNVTVCGLVCAVIGYLIGRQLHKKRLAAKEAELAEQTAETPDA